MDKEFFCILYDNSIKILAEQLIIDNPEYSFCDNLDGLYEEYMKQKVLLHTMYGKEKTLLDRHKICACLTTAIIKVRLLSKNLQKDEDYTIMNAHCANEQLAFLASWEVLKAFIVSQEGKTIEFSLPSTFHNNTFEETVARSLFMSNQLNGLSTPLIANIFYLLEKYCTDTSNNPNNPT